ncbi:ABC transporter ATP-binding protein [Pedococcus aerophilus]|uniref:ABC transporter ATP-binding protein n=1 Tax=Pedococcus aerophilus TaxID=436356 RepID=A0ABP6HDR6_9MICO
MSSTQTVRRPSGGAAVHTVPAIELTGLTKSFGSVHAVRGLDLTIAPGEVVAFLGPNGAGKTTTIDMVLGLSRPDAGSVKVHGLDPSTAVRRGLVSAVMQSGGLLKDLTARETLELTASLFAGTRPVDEVLDRAGISDLADRRVGKCSGGQQQRLRFAMALLPDPELLILDEPTTGMDVTGRRDFWSAIHEDAARGRTVVFATHYLEEADAYADRIVLVSHGEVVADGTASEVKSLVSGRTLRATLHDADPVLLQRLTDMSVVDSVELRGDTLIVTSTDSDAVARHLLTTSDAHDLEITSRGLEDAFISLTSEGAES